MKPSIGKQKTKTPNYSKETLKKNSKERNKIKQHS